MGGPVLKDRSGRFGYIYGARRDRGLGAESAVVVHDEGHGGQ